MTGIDGSLNGANQGIPPEDDAEAEILERLGAHWDQHRMKGRWIENDVRRKA